MSYPVMLVRLSRIHHDALRDLLLMAWRFVSARANDQLGRERADAAQGRWRRARASGYYLTANALRELAHKEERMHRPTIQVARVAMVMSMFVGLGSARAAADLDPKAIAVQLPSEIKWVRNGGAESAVLVGDPSKPGLYVVLQKWLPHNNSRPHFHPNDRFITVISGTWWVNTGATYDPNGMKPVPAGSFVTHFGKEIHYDGARDTECILQIVGIGPATSTQAEAK